MRTLLICLTAAIIAAPMSGCGVKKEMQNLRDTKKRVDKKLDEIQNRVGIDQEIQDMLHAVYDAYRSFLETRQQPPTSWSDLAGAPGLGPDQRVQIRNAKNRISDIVWNARLENTDTDDGAMAKLASVGNPLLSNVVILRADGGLQMVSQAELPSIVPAQ